MMIAIADYVYARLTYGRLMRRDYIDIIIQADGASSMPLPLTTAYC